MLCKGKGKGQELACWSALTIAAAGSSCRRTAPGGSLIGVLTVSCTGEALLQHSLTPAFSSSVTKHDRFLETSKSSQLGLARFMACSKSSLGGV